MPIDILLAGRISWLIFNGIENVSSERLEEFFWLFDNIDAAKTKFVNPVKIGKIDRLNSMSSDIEKMYTSPELANIFQKTGTPLDGLTKIPVIRQMLQAKATVQGMKTLYSPQTQVRNVTSASFFSLWNGHVGKSASALDSMRSVFKDIFKAVGFTGGTGDTRRLLETMAGAQKVR